MNGAAVAFFRQWGAPMLAGSLTLGLGLGFWAYVSAVTDRAERAEALLVQRDAQIVTLTQNEKDNAVEAMRLTTILSAKQELSSAQLAAEADRRKAAERRNAQNDGAYNDLKNRIENLQCGLGPDLSSSLLDNRAERDADRRSREKRIDELGRGSVPDEPGVNETDGVGT
jgi:hypothetical protein